ncbi:hypothetical protein DCAR_0726988 [Daucus carota subsp. sativus]|uniref:Knottins-like domain-containing protein n=1 Tax=Daucus carota subsp. sativus TaxID=79200 RepID=A0A161ZK83_DAUCS|nr:PREDICTED: defensin-like protein 1 [Daucus carota subsp. sativus]WOH07556.1 hypothetical protein DCAR_0726988 [Daucus carota subsp. sativus]
MGLALRLITTLFMVVMLLMSGGIREAEGRTCESQSHKFKGTCLSETNCGNVCKNEGFSGGNCRGLRRRCFCTRHC